MDQRSIRFNCYAKRKAWCWRKDFSKRRLVRMGLEGEGGLENKDKEAGGLTHEAGAFQCHLCVVLCACQCSNLWKQVLMQGSTSDFCLCMHKIKWRRLQIRRSCHRARRAPRRGDGGDSSFTAKTLSDLRAAHTAQRLPSICKPGGLRVANFFVPVGWRGVTRHLFTRKTLCEWHHFGVVWWTHKVVPCPGLSKTG